MSSGQIWGIHGGFRFINFIDEYSPTISYLVGGFNHLETY
jgi:hypothetical protein